MPPHFKLALIGTSLVALLLAALAIALWISRRRHAREAAALRDALARLTQDHGRALTLARAETDLLESLAAELRGPALTVSGAADTLAQDAVGGAARRLTDSLRRSARILVAALGAVADRGLLQDGRLLLAPAPIDLPALLHEIVDGQRPAASALGAPLSLDIAAFSGLYVLADRERLMQLLGQLVELAAAQADARGVAVTLTETVLAPTRLGARIDIVSSALVRPEYAAVLALLPTLDPLPAGLGSKGLALANARLLARLMGGALTVSLGPQDLRIRFDVEVPIAEASEVATMPQPRDDDATPEPRVAGLRRVLLVEDNRITQFIASDALMRMGFQVSTASSGAEAIEMLEQLPVDLVLTDCDMPGMHGPELARRLRADPRHAALKIIALTVDSSDRMRADCLAAGMDGFLSKPIEPHKLQQLFDEIARAPG